MTAKAGEYRTIRLPEELIGRIDSVRGPMPRERWIRALLYRVTGELLGVVQRDGHDKVVAPSPSIGATEAVSGRAEAEQAMRTIPAPSETLTQFRERNLKLNQEAHDRVTDLHATSEEIARVAEANRRATSSSPRLRLKRPEAKP